MLTSLKKAGLWALALGFSSSAFALSTTPEFPDVPLFQVYAPSTSFSDNVYFNVAGLSNLTANALSLSSIAAAFPIGAVSLSFTPTTFTGFDLYRDSVGGQTLIGTDNSATPHLSALLAPGSYHFLLSGQMGSAGLGGGYLLGANLQPVPEPSSALMLLAGVGVVGLAVSRRKRQN